MSSVWQEGAFLFWRVDGGPTLAGGGEADFPGGRSAAPSVYIMVKSKQNTYFVEKYARNTARAAAISRILTHLKQLPKKYYYLSNNYLTIIKQLLYTTIKQWL